MNNRSGPVPFFTAESIATQPSRRLLLISYHFPPGAATGSLRWQKLIKHGSDRGWTFDIITLDPSDVTKRDDSRLHELPPGTRVFGASEKSTALHRVEGVLRACRARLARSLPVRRRGPNAISSRSGRVAEEWLRPEMISWSILDRRTLRRAYSAWTKTKEDLAWADEARKVAITLTASESYTAILSSGPPHSAHVAAQDAARRAGLPFMMDLRDPWSLKRRLPESYASPLWFHLARRHEARSIRSASIISCSTDLLRRSLQRDYLNEPGRLLTVVNGYDEEDRVSSRHEWPFTVAYAGAVYLDRDPRPLFKAAGQVIRQLALSPDNFLIEFIGQVASYGGVPIDTLANAEGVGNHFRAIAQLPRADTLERLSRAAILVSLPQDSPVAIPSKVFEYMLFEAWILALAEPGSPVETLLRGTKANVVSPEDVDGIAAVLRERYHEYTRGIRPQRLYTNGRYSRRTQANILFDAIEESVGYGRG